MLTRVEPEPAGVNCARGGIAVATGLDDDGDGTLDANEIDEHAYECTLPPAPLLVREAAVPPGERCPAGGRAILVGSDHDGNGLLDAAEVESTSTVCDPRTIVDGDLTVGVEDQAALQELRVVTGTLTLTGAGPVELPALEIVGGSVRLRANESSLPKLTTVAGDLALGGGAGAVPLLARVGGDLAAGGTLAVRQLPALTSIGGDLKLVSTTALRTIALGALTRIAGGVLIERNARCRAP